MRTSENKRLKYFKNLLMNSRYKFLSIVKYINLFLIFASVLFVNGSLFSQIIYPEKINTVSVPENMTHNGNISKAFKWTDNSTENYILYCETDTYGKQNGDYFSGSKDFYIYYFRINDRQTDLVWKISDFVKDCEFDIETHFIDDALSVTDLNENGIPEIWTMYRFGCKSDVSPWPLKLIMFEGKEKYAIRGETRDYSQSYADEQDSPKKVDEKLKNSGVEFLDYSLTLWKKYNIPELK